MAYKPYKPNRGLNTKNKNHARIDDSPIKLFGFRSGLSYRMIPAMMYYLVVTAVFISSIVNELKHYSFTGADMVLFVSKYLFIGIALFSPAIFLSDFKYVEYLPLFKKKTVSSGLIGLLIVIIFSYFMWNVDLYCMSKEYKESVKAYQTEVQKDIEQMTLEQETKTDEEISMEEN
ncbi:MAG: hypothetical protein K6G64_02265 [Eubacterium sp.]|nr:hypothetical protein [Eubacterium sp.]